MESSTLQAASLSLQQARLWEVYQQSQAYHAVGAISLDGPVAIDVLQQAMQTIVERHEIFRTIFYALPGMDVPMQIVSDPQYDWRTESLKHLNFAEQQAHIKKTLQDLRADAWDIGKAPALQLQLLELADQKYLLILRLPAFCADTSTLYRLVHEISTAYAACLNHHRRQPDAEQEEEPLQYIDVSAWQNEILAEEDVETHQQLWKYLDLSSLGSLHLPGERTQENQSFQPEIYDVAMFASLRVKIEAFAQRKEISVENVLFAVWQLLLAVLTNREDIISGVSFNGRAYEELASVMGLYTRVLPVPTSIAPTSTFEQLVRLVSKDYQAASEEQNYFTWPTQQEHKSRQFPQQFEYRQWPECQQQGNVAFSLCQSYSCIEPFTLKLEVTQRSGTLQLRLHFDASRFSKQSISSLATLLITLLQEAVTRPGAQLQALSLLQPWQEEQALKHGRGPIVDFPARSLVDMFEQQVIVIPDEPAVTSNGITLTYRELNGRANALAHRLIASGVARNILVGLCTTRSVEMVIGLLAILKAGGAYVALDPQLPASRLHYQLSDTNVVYVVTQESLQHLFADYQGQTVFLDKEPVEQRENVNAILKLSDLAYVIYTSGSTGVPKGVLISHRNISNYIQALQQQCGWQAGWQFATVSTLAADLGNTVIFGSLISGGCLHILDYETATSVQRWSSYTQQYPLDVLKIVPSHLQALLSASEGQVQAQALLPRKQLIVGGETLNGRLLSRLAQLEATCDVINHYGPTETTIGALINYLGPARDAWKRASESSVPIGKPLSNLEVAILNAGGHLVPVGVVGELYIAGAGVAVGYLNQPEQTEEKFLEKAWWSQPARRYYRTGDLVKTREDGMIEFIGRVDTQVKVRGYRVELGEIEHMLCQHEQVRQSVVQLRQDQDGEPYLAAYIVSDYIQKISEKAVQSFLQERLPSYMIPAYIVRIASLPLTINGKVDREKLPNPVHLNDASDREQVVAGEARSINARDSIEARLINIWENILRISPISVLDNFFDLGGNSIIAVRLMSLIHTEFGCDLALSNLFKYPTLEAFASLLRQEIPVEPESIIVALQPQGHRLPFFCVHPSGGSIFRYQAMARALGEEQPFYGLQSPEWSEEETSLEEMAERYIQEIRLIQPYGPYQIGGWSLGGVVAFEIAQQLKRQGQTVALLALLDSGVPPSFLHEEKSRHRAQLDDATIVQLLIEGGIGTLDQDMGTLSTPQEQMELVWKQAKGAGIIPSDTGFEQFRRLAYMNCRNLLAVKYYKPVAYDGKMSFFRSEEGLNYLRERVKEEQLPADTIATGGWEQLSQEPIDVYIVPGHHNDIVDEPNVQVLARSLKSVLER